VKGKTNEYSILVGTFLGKQSLTALGRRWEGTCKEDFSEIIDVNWRDIAQDRTQ
jgi:hypothetical protein